jgi:hypothetical protein
MDRPPPAILSTARRAAWGGRTAVSHGRIRSAAAVLVLVAATAAISVAFWPGHMNLDTLGTYNDAATGKYSDWHSAIWTAIWRALLPLGIASAGWMLVIGVLLTLTGLYLLLRVRLARPLALIGAVLVFAFPPVLAFDIEVGTDVWFLGSILCSAGFVARSARTQGAERMASAALAVVFAFLAQAARPTAAPAVFAVLAGLAAITIGARLRAVPRALGAVAAGAVATLLLFGAVLGVQRYVLHAAQTHPEQTSYQYDLVALSIQQNQLLLSPEMYPRQDVAYLAKYGRLTPAATGAIDLVPLLWGGGAALPVTVEGAQLARLQQAWVAAIRQHPTGYLQERLQLALWQLGITAPQVGVYYGPTPTYLKLGSTLVPSIQDRLVDYTAIGTTANATGGPLQTVWVYVLVLLLSTPVYLLWRRRPGNVVLGLVSVALLLYTLELLFLSPGVTYRYVWPAVATASALALVLASDVVGWLWQRVVRRRDRVPASPVLGQLERNPTGPG